MEVRVKLEESEKKQSFTLSTKQSSSSITFTDHREFLSIKINLLSFDYFYEDLIEMEKKFDVFGSLENIFSFLLSSFEKDKIEVIEGEKFIIKISDFSTFSISLSKGSLLARINRVPIFYPESQNILERNDKPKKPIKKEATPELKSIEVVESSHISAIYSLGFLKDGRLVSGSNDKMIIVYNSQTYTNEIMIRNAHSKGVLTVCGLSNGHLASGSGDDLIKIWEINKTDFKLFTSLTGHTGWIYKIIELEDCRLSSCSHDGKIIIWDNYKASQTLTHAGHSSEVRSILEVQNYIVSSTSSSMMIWEKSTCECIKVFYSLYCNSSNGISIIENDQIMIGGRNELNIVDISVYNVKKITNESFGNINCFLVLKHHYALFGNDKGMIFCFFPQSGEVEFQYKMQNSLITCIIKNEDNKIFSSSYDKTIKTFKVKFISEKSRKTVDHDKKRKKRRA